MSRSLRSLANEPQELTVGNQCRNECSKNKVHKDDIIKAGDNALVILFYGNPVEDLNGLYFRKFREKMLKSYVNDLPPTFRDAQRDAPARGMIGVCSCMWRMRRT